MIYLIVWLLIASGAIYSLYMAFKLAEEAGYRLFIREMKRTCTICKKEVAIKDIKTVLWTGMLDGEYKPWCHCKECIKNKT